MARLRRLYTALTFRWWLWATGRSLMHNPVWPPGLGIKRPELKDLEGRAQTEESPSVEVRDWL